MPAPKDPKKYAEYIKRLSSSHKGKNRGPWSEEVKKKMSESQRKIRTPEYRAKMSIANKGKKRSLEARIKMSEAKRNYKPAWISQGEKEMLNFIKSIYNGVILENYRKLFPHKGYEIDIYLPEKKLAFEFNGEYWHGPKFPKTVARDFWKQEHAKNLGVQIYFIWESDWKNRRKECENFIKEVL